MRDWILKSRLGQLKNRTFRSSKIVSVANVLIANLITLCVYSTAQASPWMEANDPFLRSDLTLLSDSGYINSPINQYPLRWSTFGDQLASISANGEPALNLARNHVSYALNTAKFGRGNRSLKLIWGNESPTNMGYGAYGHDEWGAYASYEHLENSFAFRLTSGYANYVDDQDFTWSDSYLSLNAGSWLFSVGSLDRWWGQGWQHNLILSSNAKATSDISLSYIGDGVGLGKWNMETILSQPEGAAQDNHAAIRVMSKPFDFLEYGLTYQLWFDKSNFNEGDKQAALDAKVSLPEISSLYHSVYAELASTSTTNELGAWLLGWTGQFSFLNQSWRLVLENLQSSDNKAQAVWEKGNYPSYSKNVVRNNYLVDDSWSVSMYLQMENDHDMSIALRQSSKSSEDITDIKASYRLLAFAGMVNLGVGHLSEGDKSDNQFWSAYEFRF